MPQDIHHIVVLMMENRSFDHMLGYLKRPDYDIDGLTGTESNPIDPQHPANRVTVSNDAGDILAPDPGNSFQDVNVQLFNQPSGPPPVGPANEGFVFSYSQQSGVTPATASTIMKCFDASRLPVLTTLAQEFAVCDRWFSSVPGPTWPNRFFAHCATSNGYLDNSLLHNWNMPTVFEKITAKGLTWRDYYHDLSQTWALSRLRTDDLKGNFCSFSQFKTDARRGRLPQYSFIEPKYFSFLGTANDQHPPHDIRAGEHFIADVYNAVRSSPLWEQTLLVITYDEHGGLYDHVLPPRATPPDARTSQFAFDRYGVRVPALLISPYISKKTIVHDRIFDHASIPATLKRVFRLDGFLTARDRDAEVFSDIPSLPAPRPDTPMTVGTPGVLEAESVAEEHLDVHTIATMKSAGQVSSAGLSAFQRSLVELAHQLEIAESPKLHALRTARRIESEYDAAVYVREVAERFLKTKTRKRSK
jgi:phospholipase C